MLNAIPSFICFPSTEDVSPAEVEAMVVTVEETQLLSVPGA